ncbi:two-component regulator propeller domain-containing protein [Mucilaginibacter sp. KACC 22773]|uniref:ligand-binding sensor domain-containing protein n=1 Tax=Mucilaginibacter sp. KACC 22773 TaxID=3025671 RepID=UPI0023650FA6|nr:sensor histidine kinase [Mucilaginibacter sp. KACC 22773]WDF78789.1 two-component regulator propeller domain-containing protein [Mucilaginibacter sp. KACC 22773]
MYRKFILLLLLNGVLLVVHAQKLDKIRPAYISVKDGLPDATINTICQDDDGFLWLGTNYGLSRYDGVEFKNFHHSRATSSLPGNNIISVQKFPGHRLLVATSTGLCMFNTRANTFKNLLVPASAKMFPFENNFYIVSVDKQNNIWAASQTGLYKLDQNLNILQFIKGPNDQGATWVMFVESIHALPNGSVLFRLVKGKKIQYHIYTPTSNKIIPLNQLKGYPLSVIDSLNVRDIAFDKNGNLWFVKHMVDSVFFLNSISGQVTASTFNHLPGKGQIYYNTHINLLNNGLATCTLSDGGLAYWNTDTPAIGHSGFKSGILLPKQHVFCTLFDTEGNLWVGTNNGLYKFTLIANGVSTIELPAYNAEDQRGIDLSGTFVVKDHIFLTTTGGGVFYTNQINSPWKEILMGETAGVNDTWNIRAAGRDKFWIGTQRGIYEWKKGQAVPRPVNVPLIGKCPVVTQFTDKENFLWMGLGEGNGLAAYNLTNNRLQLYSKKDKNNPLPIRFPVCIAEDEFGDLWMGGTEGRGLVKWSRANHKFVLFPTAYNTDFDNGVINAIYADGRGKIWMGTNAGLVKFDISSQKFKKVDMPEALSSNTVYSLAADNKSRLWIGTKNGLNCMEPGTGHFFLFGGYYPSSEDPVLSVKYDSTVNKVYFNTAHIFYSAIPNQLLRPRRATGVLITAVTSSGNNLNPAQSISLPANDNNISIAFSAVNLVDGMQNRYYYRLNNLSKNWISVGRTRQISFSNLLSGKYTFRVKAQMADGTMSTNQATLLFSVQTPYYKSWWFIVLAIITAGGIIYFVYLNRIRQLLRVQAIRNSIATDLHDDIGSTLSNINILTELSNANLSAPEQARRFLKRITEEVNTSNQSLDDIVWSINTLNDSYEQTVARMKRYTAELFEGANIAYHFHFDEKIAHKKLHMEKRKDIYLVFKEAVNNIYKHAAATYVDISLQTNQNHLQMIIKDNGKGFDTTQPTARNGIKNMKIRLAKWKGSISILSASNEGTLLTIIIPLL